MEYSKYIKPISYLKSQAAQIVELLSETRKPLIITQNGEAKLAVIDIKSFDEYNEKLALLKLLAMGNKQIEEGKVLSAEAVFAELDKDDIE